MTNTDELQAQLEGIAAALGLDDTTSVRLDRPRNPEHGDVATNLAMTLASRLGQPPRAVAEQIISRLDLPAAGLKSAEIAGPGFINFRFSERELLGVMREILSAGDAFGQSDFGSGTRVQVEFVSANPTGPLHVAHGRGAALGDAIAALLDSTGHAVEREFYVNDAGVQIDRLAQSLDARWLELRGESVEFPEDGYHGEYVRDMAREVDAQHGDRLAACEESDRLTILREWAMARIREEQDRDLRDFRVHFDHYFEESTLYRKHLLQATLTDLADRGLTYEADGAVWMRTSEWGDDKDRVLVKSDGTYTYFLPDLAYHREKAERGFTHVIDVWGADHHGYVPRMQAALRAIGLADFLDVEIVQMVKLMRGGNEVRLSKRSGQFVTLRELFDECGVDVARYFFLMRRSDAQMLFDLDLALDHSEKNPVYKVQYAHARMMSIFRKAGVSAVPGPETANLEPLSEPGELELIKQLAILPEAVERATRARAPHVLCEFLETTAAMVNSWYHAGNPSRNPELAVLVSDVSVRGARLELARAIRIVLRNGLRILGLEAPDQMQREELE